MHMPKNERGQALIDFAIVMPLLLFIMMGVVQLSLIISARITLKYAAFSAARAAISADHLNKEGVIPTYPSGVDYGGDVVLGEATEAALLVMSAIPVPSGGTGDDIILPGWGALRNSSASRDRLQVTLPDTSGASLLQTIGDATTRDQYELVTADLVYDMELLFPRFVLSVLGIFDNGLNPADGTNTIQISDTCTLAKEKVPGS